jgi:hypothetical protein
MQRVFMHLHEAGHILWDEEGCMVRDLNEACKVATETARSLMAADIARGRISLDNGIEVVDDGGKRLAYVVFRDAVVIDGV